MLLFAHAKPGKYRTENIVRRNFSCNGAEMVEYLADILGEQVARQAFLYALSGSGERFGGMNLQICKQRNGNYTHWNQPFVQQVPELRQSRNPKT